MFVDSHCHLDDARFADDLDAVLDRARHAAGVIAFSASAPAMARRKSTALFDLPNGTNRYAPPSAYIRTMHPNSRRKLSTNLRALAAHPKVIAFGEIGLDYHYDFSPREVQREVFITQLKLAQEVSLPITIHTREAWEDTMSILRDTHWTGAGTHAHCFTGDPDTGPGSARRAAFTSATAAF